MDTDSFINAIQKPIEIHWKHIASIDPAFFRFVALEFSPLPEGAIKRDDYEKFMKAYEEQRGQTNG